MKLITSAIVTLGALSLCAPVLAQGTSPAGAPARAATSAAAVPPDYTIGPEDVLSVTLWREPEMSVESVVVRPDGKISLPLLNEIDAASLTPEQLRATIAERAKKFVADPNVSVVVREIHSRRAFITGKVVNPGAYPIGGGTTVLQLIALSGGLSEFANGKRIVVTRVEGGQSVALTFNYAEVSKGKSLSQNIALRPGDTVIVP
jgi:polysaccharide export outer membrane protein